MSACSFSLFQFKKYRLKPSINAFGLSGCQKILTGVIVTNIPLAEILVSKRTEKLWNLRVFGSIEVCPKSQKVKNHENTPSCLHEKAFFNFLTF
jgi:hypothetical protein